MNEFDYYWDIFIRWMTTPIMGSDSGITISNMLGFVLIVFVAWWASAKVEKILQRMTLGKSYLHIDDSTFYLI
ncbi:MAG TPA: potassium transporter KefA, partial [Methylophaga sp.]|nr:potassium transporter KefA [Methylophaga sp.]